MPYSRYGRGLPQRAGRDQPAGLHHGPGRGWLPALGPAVERLASGGRLVDVGCGQGWSAIAVARAFPSADVWGVDVDAASVTDARVAAEQQGVSATFVHADAAELADVDPFDVALLLEALHDLARPVEVLEAVRAALVPDGALLVADEAVAPAFTAPGDDVERMMYGWSITHCLPASMAEQPSAGVGTVLREDVVRELAARAGFGQVDVLDVDGGFFRLYALRP